MASTRISAPARGVTHRLSRLSIRQDARSTRCIKCLSTPFARSITTSTSSRASVTPITTSASDYVPIRPLHEQTVLATIHRFPSLEPLRFETYPANHLYLPTRRDILHRAIVYEGDSTRRGTASTKTRYEVHGSRKKIRPQKGSGRARLGDKKSPMLRGGGVAFGPHPRDFATELPKKVYDLAWRTALSYRFRKGELIIVDNAMEIESPSVRLLGDIFKYHEKIRGSGRSLLVTLDERPILEEALIRMDRGEQTLTWEEVDVKDLLELSRVIIERDALHNILLSHEEDLTHTALQPWHKSLVKSNPPSELESITGWSEFRDLQLSDKDITAQRAAAYASVAAKRYETASTLPEGSPERTDLTISVYNLTANAKEIQFLEKTGTSWQQYAQPDAGQDTVAAVEWREDAATKFPALQAIEYQISRKSDLAMKAAQTSRPEADEIELEIAKLELDKVKILHKAALLAAQVDEHYAEAQRLGLGEGAEEEAIRLASHERSSMALLEVEILEHKLRVAETKERVLFNKKVFGKEMTKLKAAIVQWREKLAAARAESEEVEVTGEEAMTVLEEKRAAEAPVVEELKREEKKKV